METRYDIIPAEPGFWRIEEDGVRSFLVAGAHTAMLVDTGFGGTPMGEVVSGLTDRPVMLVNTHTDGDHTGRNHEFEAVYLHPAEMEHYSRPAPDGSPRRRPPVRPLWEGAVIDLGGWKFEVILTPGHTPGSIMLLERERRLLISGDSLQYGDIFLFGPGRSLPAFRASLERLRELVPAFDAVWPSHGPCPIGPEAVEETIAAVDALATGTLAPREPERPFPFTMPAKWFTMGHISILYDPEAGEKRENF